MQRDQLSPVSGEFIDRARETAFQAERLPETMRHGRLLLLWSVGLNTLFFLSDWRFFGEPHFWVAIPARAVVVAISLLCFVALHRARDFPRAQAALVTWEWINGAAVAVLVTSRSDIALFVVVMLPAIYYIVVPTSFRWTVLGGGGCGVMLLVGYLAPVPYSSTTLGLVLAMLMLNLALLLVVVRSNRLRRLEWAATQAERRAKDELAESRRMVEKMLMAVPVPLLVTARADGRLMMVNDAGLAYFGGDPDKLGIKSVEELYVDPARRMDLINALARDGRVSGFETAVRLADGSVRDVLVAATALDVGGTPCVIAGVVDITNRKAMELNLERLATTDPLTGLANRSRFFALAAREIERARRYGRPLAVLMVDMDHFKRINDTWGHEVGDLVLRAFADLCRRTLRDSDVVARFGGEEFVLLLPEADRASALAVADRLRIGAESLAPAGAPPSLRVTVSIGLSAIHAGETAPDAALVRADRALYAAKKHGRNRVEEYDPALLDDVA
ncbi:sensor domain-containing diguanylate cyclase [Chelatococcus sp. SYSU_G07232]|uniref:diguanylate cyclase n=1 Tax=Chelatococcus albus TaxID=3047466 RepID=A0ABT7AIY1_9HYPH|nr:sensor domain-containing diguanylate cyclase [Chelatococcus sp. SYSU_G07232]MDJ1159335.1 sensor domain-containing diguanylate cyclase [Chelatococcus sp. SYSU_G07232]